MSVRWTYWLKSLQKGLPVLCESLALSRRLRCFSLKYNAPTSPSANPVTALSLKKQKEPQDIAIKTPLLCVLVFVYDNRHSFIVQHQVGIPDLGITRYIHYTIQILRFGTSLVVWKHVRRHAGEKELAHGFVPLRSGFCKIIELSYTQQCPILCNSFRQYFSACNHALRRRQLYLPTSTKKKTMVGLETLLYVVRLQTTWTTHLYWGICHSPQMLGLCPLFRGELALSLAAWL